jgi:LuxR family transcriptional regulator, maltose regulon positive regulatory protein
VVTLDALLLDSKLSVPQPRPGSVSRAGLIETARGSGCRVVGVTAPAGYGKSTLLAEWALAEDRRVAWVSFDRFDDDPALLLTLLASAYARVSPWPPSMRPGCRITPRACSPSPPRPGLLCIGAT